MVGLLLGRLPEPSPRLVPPSGWGGVSRRARRRRLLKKRGNAWMLWLMALSLVLPTGCVTVASSVVGASASAVGAYFDYKGAEKGEAVIVTPPLSSYSAEVLKQAADEMDSMKQPCARDIPGDCSAVSRMVIDYGELREKIRAAKGG